MDATANNAPVLQVRGLTKRFGGLTAVKNLNLDLRAGEIFGLIGPNGSGKSTAMKAIMGIERPTAGDVIFQGENVAGLPAHKIARKGFGMVFQHSRPLNRQTVLENIMVALLPDSLFMLFPDKALTERARWIADRVGLGAVMDRRPPTLPFADLRRLELAKAIARDPKVVLVDEPFAGLTLGEVGTFSELIRSFRDEGRAVLLVDHNVKSVAALVDRVLAMYLGEEIVTGRADEVMRNETVRRVYLGGAIETSARPETSFKDKVPLLQVENVSVHYGKAQALENVSIHVHEGEFVSVVGLNGAGKTTLFNTISGFLPYSGEIVRGGEKLRGTSPARIARSGIVQCPESRELFGEMTVRENLDLGGQHLTDEVRDRQLAWLFELFPILKERQGQIGADFERRRTADAGDRPCADDATEDPDPGRADPGIGPGYSRIIVQGPGETAPDDADHGVAGRAERDLRASPCRPGLCAGTCADRLGGRSRPFRRGSRRRLSLNERCPGAPCCASAFVISNATKQSIFFSLVVSRFAVDLVEAIMFKSRHRDPILARGKLPHRLRLSPGSSNADGGAPAGRNTIRWQDYPPRRTPICRRADRDRYGPRSCAFQSGRNDIAACRENAMPEAAVPEREPWPA